jgi:uncharacterized protein involved in outer membrane biogenesis
MRLKTILMAAAGVVLLLGVAAAVALRSLDVNRYKGLIAGQVKAATGRELRLGGNLDLKIGLSPAVTAQDVSFANAPWGSRPEMMKLRRLELEVALLPLLFRDLRVKRLVLVQPDILLETNARGIGNWSLDGRASSSTAPGTKPGEPTAGLAGLAAEEVRIERGTLTYRDGRTRRATSLALHRLDLRAKDLTSPVRIDLSAAYNGKAFTLAGTLGPLAELRAPSRPYPVQLTLQAADATLRAEGTVAKPLEAAGLDIQVTAKGPELAQVARLADQNIPALGPFAVTARVAGSPQALSVSALDASIGTAEQVSIKATGAVKDALNARGINLAAAVQAREPRLAAKRFGVDLPALPPLNLAARLRDAPGAYAFEDLKASLGKSTLAGSGTIPLGGPRPAIKAQLASKLLDLSELFPGGEATRPGAAPSREPPAPSREKRVFPADHLPLGGLKAADADLEVKLDRVVLPNKLTAEAVALRLRLAGGRLEVDPLAGRIAGGTLQGRVLLDASAGKTAALAAKLDAKRVNLGQVLRELGKPDLVSGTPTDLALDLRGSGASVRDLMAGLNGDLLLTLGEGRIHSGFVDWLGADVLTQVAEKLNPGRKTDPYTDLQCAVARFSAKDGIASTDRGIALETNRMNLVSSGTANLRTEAIDFSLRPEARQGVGIGAGALVKLLRVRGTLAEPSLGVDTLEVAKTAGAIVAAAPTFGLSLLAGPLADKATADPHPCRTALAKPAVPARAAAPPRSPAPAAQEPPQQETGVQRILRGLFGK